MPSSCTSTSSPSPDSRKKGDRPSPSDDEKVKADESFVNIESFTACCTHCRREKSREKPLLVCSRCKHTRYCSKECQLAHYPLHRAPCRRNALTSEQAERTVLANPILSYANKDAAEHLNTISGEAIMAARSALRLGKSDSLARSHVLILRFKYDGKPVILRERFRFSEVIVRPFEEHLKISQESLHPSIRRIMPESNTVPASFFGSEMKDGMYVGLIHEIIFDVGGKPVIMRQHTPLIISPTKNYNIYGDYRSLHLNTHWQEAFRWSLSRPTRNYSLLLIEDLFMSEGRAMAEMRMERAGREMDRLIHFIALLKADDDSEEEKFAEEGKVKQEDQALHDECSRTEAISTDDIHPVVRALMGGCTEQVDGS